MNLSSFNLDTNVLNFNYILQFVPEIILVYLLMERQELFYLFTNNLFNAAAGFSDFIASMER
jgi:hypothetical protein